VSRYRENHETLDAQRLDACPVDYSDVLRRAMDSLFKTFENFSEGTFIVDKDARVVWINKRYAARFGFSDPQEAIGRDCEA